MIVAAGRGAHVGKGEVDSIRRSATLCVPARSFGVGALLQRDGDLPEKPSLLRVIALYGLPEIILSKFETSRLWGSKKGLAAVSAWVPGKVPQMNRFESLLHHSAVLLADGAMGTMLFESGLDSGDSPQAWNITHPERVRAVHHAYLEAGSQILLSNTFGSNRFRLGRHSLQSQVSELNRTGAALLRAEVDHAGGLALVAGDMGPTGELLAPLGSLKYADAVDAFAEQAGALLAGGVDLIWVETMSALQEIQAAIEGVRRVSTDIPIVVTMTFEKHGRTMMGVTPEQAAKALSEWGVRALGGNCGTGPEELLAVIGILHGLVPEIPVVFKPNAGVPELVDGKTRYNATEGSMARAALAAVAAGARILGACCGSTPNHVRAMRDELPKNAA